MNRAEQALHELKEMDELAAMNSPVHRFSALSKLAVTVSFIVIVMSFGKYDLSGVLMMALYPYFLFQLSGISFKTCVYKMRYIIPLIAFIGSLPAGSFAQGLIDRLGWSSATEEKLKLAWLSLCMVLSVMFLVGQSYNPFIYFQF
jgi:cobalt/nickel transport system permease protein